MSKRLLPLIAAGLVVEQVISDADRILIRARPRSASALCPACGRASDRLHSCYVRTIADLPWQGRAVSLQVQARRLRCVTVGCRRRIFAERLSGVARPYGRRTDRLGDVQRHLGLALGGEAGTRLARRLSFPVSAATLLRLVRDQQTRSYIHAPRVIGVDDWAWRRGQRYGTILYSRAGPGC